MRKLAIASLFVFLAAPASAQEPDTADRNESFTGVKEVVIADYTGRLNIKIGGTAVDATFAGGEVPFPFSMDKTADVLTLAGEERPRSYNIHHEINWRRYHERAFEKFIEDYPVLTLTLPEGTALTLDEAIAIVDIGDLNASLTVSNGYLEGEIGDVSEASIRIYGPSDLRLGAVANHLHAKLGGSGDFAALSAGSADLGIGGSGDMVVGAIDGDADLKVGGSGDLSVANVNGALTAHLSGSGDIKTGDVDGGGEFKLSGSGDIFTRSINGPAAASISGSGDISIRGGRAEDLEVSIRGSGDFEFAGVSTNLDASVNGSGSVDVAENIGSLRTSGRGDFRVGGVTIEND